MISRRFQSGAGALTRAVVVLLVGACGGCGIADPRDPNTPRVADVIWQTSIPSFGPPATDDSSVFFSTTDHHLAAINRATGVRRWASRSDVFGDNLVTHNSPVRTNSVVVFGDEDLYGFDPVTGERKWVFRSTGGLRLAAGVYPFRTDGSRIYAGSVAGAAFAIDAATGNQVWRADLLPGPDQQVRVFAVGNGMVYATLKYGGLPYSGRVNALDANTGALVWTYELPKTNGQPNATQEMALANDAAQGSTLIVGFNDGRVLALNAVTGTPRWTLAKPGPEDFDTRFSVSGDMLFNTYTHNVIAGYDMATGIERWRVLSDQGSPSAAFRATAADESLGYVVFMNGFLAAYDLQTGARRWVVTAPVGFFHGGPIISNDTLFLAGNKGMFAIRK